MKEVGVDIHTILELRLHIALQFAFTEGNQVAWISRIACPVHGAPWKMSVRVQCHPVLFAKSPCLDIESRCFIQLPMNSHKTLEATVALAAEISQHPCRGTLWLRGSKLRATEDVWEVCVGRNLSGPVVIKR